jgi:4-diphosphocytidyl-2-C-methyl-D-erythritol kinase
MALVVEAPAKLNLFLEVLGRREDGYHEIDTVMQTISLCDRLTLEPCGRMELEVEGDAPADRSNLAWRAAEALGVSLRIRLEKRIPAGAGLGGGSSDAAAVLLAGNRLLDLGLRAEELARRAQALGADVPFFLKGGLARCRGIGERVDPVSPAPRNRFLIVAPERKSSTAAVYGAFRPPLTQNPQIATVFLQKYCVGEGPGHSPCFNRLQAVAEGLDPALRKIRQAAEAEYGATFTMTGSGAAYFAVLEEGNCPVGARTVLGGTPVWVRAVEARGRNEDNDSK